MSIESKPVGIDTIPLLWYGEFGAIMTFSDPRIFSQPERIFPASLRVNSESRTETLHYYSSISLSNAFEDLPDCPKHCLNWGLDCFLISKLLGATAPHQDMYQKWLDYLGSRGKGGLAKLQYLEVRGCWGHRESTPDHRYEVQNEQLHPGARVAVILPLIKFILGLTGLQLVLLTWHIRAGSIQALRSLLKLEEFRAMMQEALERHKDNFVDGRAPVVQIRYRDKEEELYVYPPPDAIKDLRRRTCGNVGQLGRRPWRRT